MWNSLKQLHYSGNNQRENTERVTADKVSTCFFNKMTSSYTRLHFIFQPAISERRPHDSKRSDLQHYSLLRSFSGVHAPESASLSYATQLIRSLQRKSKETETQSEVCGKHLLEYLLFTDTYGKVESVLVHICPQQDVSLLQYLLISEGVS